MTTYPISASMQKSNVGWQDYVATSLKNNAELATKGSSAAKENLVMRIGQIRASVKTFSGFDEKLIEAMKTAIAFLKTQGYKINLNNSNPELWITN